MPHPNALPESKEYYIQALLLNRATVKATWVSEVVVCLYHAEVPLETAQEYLRALARSGYPQLRGRPYWFDRALAIVQHKRPPPPAITPESLVYLFAAFHGDESETLAALTTLAGKLPASRAA